MNLTEVQICSPGENNTTITHLRLPFKNVNPHAPYVLKGITGLDPEEIIRTYNDGPHFWRIQPKERVVGMSIKLNPDYTGGLTIGDLRDQIYKIIAFNSKGYLLDSYLDPILNKTLELRFMNGFLYVASLFGTVNRFDANIQSSEPDIQFNIECDDPFMRSTTRYDASSNIDVTPDETSHVVNGTTFNVGSSFSYNDELSTAPHGFHLLATCVSEPPSSELSPKQVIIWDGRLSGKFYFAAAYDWQVGDKLYLNSQVQDRNYFLVRASDEVYVGLMDKIYWGSIWPFMHPGENFFEISEGFHITSVSHAPSYWGV